MPWWSFLQNLSRRKTKHDVDQMDAVRWFDPMVFLETGFFILKASVQLDYREIEFLHGDQQVFSYEDEVQGVAGDDGDGDFWFDYMADTGDGWNSTYSVFGSLALPEITALPPRAGASDSSGTTEAGSPGPVTLPRGRVLILGGDEVYPFGNDRHYQQRLVGPIEAALPRDSGWTRLQKRFLRSKAMSLRDRRPHAQVSLKSAALQAVVTERQRNRDYDLPAVPNANGAPDMFAVAGNHDWFDGLASWKRLFCEGRMLGGWNTLQKRSYFAVLLPHRWWLIGIDIRLNQDIDKHQLNYFRGVHDKHMRDGDHVVLMTPEPDWIWSALHEREELNANLDLLDNLFLTQNLVLYLTGDFHHYRRHVSSVPRQASAPGSVPGLPHSPSQAHLSQGGGAGGHDVHKIVAGGGGAFLHPTHGTNTKTDKIVVNRVPFKLAAEFPSRAVSRRLTYRNLAFAYYNWRFSVAVGAVHLVLWWMVEGDLGYANRPSFGTGGGAHLHELAYSATRQPWPSLCFVFLFAGFTAFADVHTPGFRAVVGFVHALTHALSGLITIYFSNWVSEVLLRDAGGAGWRGDADSVGGNHRGAGWLDRGDVVHRVVGLTAAFTSGFMLGSVLVGLYLLLALNVFGAHVTESFSSFSCQDYKNFLRLRIDRHGTLTVYPIGIEKVPRRWVDRWADKTKASDGNEKRRVAPSENSGTEPTSVPKLRRGQPRFEPEGGWDTLRWQLIEEPITLQGPKRKHTAEL